MPKDFVKIFERDLAAADIPKRDERGRTVDLHALRHTFGTHLSRNGVAPRTAQAAMRHSSLDLTMNVYTAPSLLDVAGALATLPELSLQDVAQAEAVVGRLHPHLMCARRDRVRAFGKAVVDPKKSCSSTWACRPWRRG